MTANITERTDREPRTSLSSAFRRRLALIAEGREAQFKTVSLASVVMDGILERRGLIRAVRHRDHTRSYQLTEAGRDALTEMPTC